MFFSRGAGLKYIDRGNLPSPDFEVGSFTFDNNWHALDLSGIIPINTKIVIGRVVCQETTKPKNVVMSTNGLSSGYNAVNRWTQSTTSYLGFEFFMSPTSDRKIHYRINAGTWTMFELVVLRWFVK